MTYGLHFTVREGGLIRETKLPMQELELKMQGGGAYARGGGVIAGFYGTYPFCPTKDVFLVRSIIIRNENQTKILMSIPL